jgi:phosphate acyltransferase
MGGDSGIKVTIPAALLALKEHPALDLILVGDEVAVRRALDKTDPNWDQKRLLIKHTTQVVAMDDLPSVALRSKRDSSMRVAVNLVHDGIAQACVSAGNTGALMAIARFILKMLPGVDRPAILFPIPSRDGVAHVLDLGANVECQAEHLLQFAVMGSILVTATTKIKRPKVGLLNVGSEQIKGTDSIKRAAELISQMPDINYIGYVEGDDIYKGGVDVVVCDGFVGNVALKASEGVAKMILHFAKEEFSRNWFTKLIALISKPVLTRVFMRSDPNQYNGGSLLGLQGVVLKSHGGANAVSFASAIDKAVKEVQMNVPEKIRASVAATLGEEKLA